jgi:hypothetical protein
VWLRQLLEPPASVSQMPTCLAQYYGFVTVVVSNWDLNSGPWACWAATLPLEPLFALGYFLDRVFHSPPHTSYLLSLKPSFRSWSFHNLWFSWEDSCSSPGLLSSWDYSCEPPHPAPSTNYSYCFFGVPTLWITPGDGGFFGVFNLSTCLLYVYLNHFIPRVPIFLV